MSFLGKISIWLWGRAFAKYADKQRATRARNTEALKTALLIYDAEGNQESRKYLEAWLQDLGIKTDSLGITTAKLPKGEPAKAGLMYRNDFHFWSEPKTAAVPEVIKEQHDVLICISEINGRKADLLSAMAHSPYKIGPDREYNRPAFDLLFKLRAQGADHRSTALGIIKIFTEIKYEKV